ncbi:MAG: histidine phosphatase family protein [Clostridia bacterium]|nr:histidine phosphatase family protein [Clostridia bacterium]
MKKIITFQHTRSRQHENGMIGSLADWELTEEGMRQAACIGKRLAAEMTGDEFVLYSSDLRRAVQTAECIAQPLHLTPRYTPALREFDLGEALGHTKAWAKENACCPLWPGTIDWADRYDGVPFPGAESRQDIWNRMADFLDTLLADPVENCILVSHSGTLSILFALWLGMDIGDTDHCLLSGKPGGISELQADKDGHRILVRLNDMSYLQD